MSEPGVTSPSPKMYKCQLCSERFSSIPNLKSHILGHLAADKQLKLLPKNINRNESKRLLKTHLKTDKNSNYGLKYSCVFCEEIFCPLNSFENNLTSHTRETPFLCKDCDYQTGSDQNFKTHLKIHDIRRRPTFSCS